METIEERFLKFVDEKNGGECWLWKGGKKSTGRGNFWLNGKTIQAHRMMWTLKRGEIPDGMFICHTCDNGLCVNPDHLFLGTCSDNLKDMANKGRHPWLQRRGENHFNARLTEKDVIEIRRLHSIGGISEYKLAEMFGVARTTIEMIVIHRTWKHLP